MYFDSMIFTAQETAMKKTSLDMEGDIVKLKMVPKDIVAP